MNKKTICIDFDGVLHSYSSGWKGVGIVSDPPVEGAIEWLQELLEDGRFTVCIYSSRSKELDGIVAMQRWLHAYGLQNDEIESIAFPDQKPPAFVTIDDRAICFEGPGTFPSPDYIARFTPWNKVPEDVRKRIVAWGTVGRAIAEELLRQSKNE